MAKPGFWSYVHTDLRWVDAGLVIPALIVGIAKKGVSGLFAGPNNWCYFNCPWETWAYAVQGSNRTNIEGVDDIDRKMIWPAKYVIAWAIPFFAVALFLAGLAVASAWSGPAPAKKAGSAPKHRAQATPLIIPVLGGSDPGKRFRPSWAA